MVNYVFSKEYRFLESWNTRIQIYRSNHKEGFEHAEKKPTPIQYLLQRFNTGLTIQVSNVK